MTRITNTILSPSIPNPQYKILKRTPYPVAYHESGTQKSPQRLSRQLLKFSIECPSTFYNNKNLCKLSFLLRGIKECFVLVLIMTIKLVYFSGVLLSARAFKFWQ